MVSVATKIIATSRCDILSTVIVPDLSTHKTGVIKLTKLTC
jgi:hypothetical protein